MSGHKNFEAKTIGEYVRQYSACLESALSAVSVQALEKALGMVKKTIGTDNHVYVAGNGGSASIANHLCCDFTKGTYSAHEAPLRTHSLSSNEALVTALGNDMGFEDIFSQQLKMLASKGDLLILISSSGNSKNIVKAAKLAREIGVMTLGLTGFAGGEVASWLDCHLHIEADNYGIVEDAHQALMHVISQFIGKERGKTSAQ